MRVRTLAGALAGALGLLVGLVGFGPASNAGAAAAWAPAATATIHPGVMMFTEGAQCTANFVYSDGGNTYLGYAAHCAGLGAATDTNGCTAPTLPVGTPVEIDGASQPGVLAYSSWVTMQNNGESDPDTCAYNDLALVRLNPADVPNVNPSVPHWGGPNGVDPDGLPAGSLVYTYGNSSLRLGITQLSPKSGVSLGTTGGGWSHPTYTVSPGIPGDSGSALLGPNGQAAGVLSTLAVAPLPASNNFGDLSHEIDYMHSHGGPQAGVVDGTEPFNAFQLPLGI
jgi:hypothetical protein